MSEATSYLAETTPQTAPQAVAAQPNPTNELSGDEAHLHSIFPDLDSATIHDCYVLCERNVERTVEFLLGDASTNVTNAQGGMSQSDIDEQLARHLEQEELSAAAAHQQRAWVPQQEQGQLPAIPRQQASSQTAPSDGPDLQEQFNKIAETGKRTFNTIFNKVKEKLREFDQPPPGSTSSSSQPYYAPENAYRPEMTAQPQPRAQVAPASPTHQTNYAPPAGPPLGHQPKVATESSATPISSTAANATAAPAPAPAIDVSKAAFLAKKPTPLTETSKPHPEDDLTENPFDDRAN